MCEILAYFELLFLIGIKKAHHANVKELWSADGSSIEITRATMSYKRFLFLCRCLRFDDRETRAERRAIDKLSPIRTTFDLFLKNINQNYNLNEYTALLLTKCYTHFVVGVNGYSISQVNQPNMASKCLHYVMQKHFTRVK
jgi:hypothetical protein